MICKSFSNGNLKAHSRFSIRRLGLSSELSNETSLRGVVKFEHPKNVYSKGARREFQLMGSKLLIKEEIALHILFSLSVKK